MKNRLKILMMLAAWVLMSWSVLHAQQVTIPPAPAPSATNGPVCTPMVFNLSNEELRTLEDKASKGDAEAAIRIANYYALTKDDRGASLKWYRRAEELGSAKAAYNLAFSYEFELTPPDYKSAFGLYQKWAKRGDASSM